MIKDTIIGTAGPAIKNMMATLGAGGLLMSGWLGFQGTKSQIADWEVANYPVLKRIEICEGEINKDTGECSGGVFVYDDFAQTSMRCDGKNAIVSGTMSKIRSDAKYVEGGQTVRYGSPDGRSMRAFWTALDQPKDSPTNRRKGVQDWGPWLLIDGCSVNYRTWYTTVTHEPWHGLWDLVTTSGTYPLPDRSSDHEDHDEENS